MRSFRSGRVACFAPIVLAALASSGCPNLNTQPDYMARQNGQFSVADPLPAASDEAAGAAPSKTGMFDHPNISISQGGELSDQMRPAR